MSKMLAAMHAARQTYGGAARKRDSVGGGIYRALDKIGSDIEEKSASEKAEDQAGDDFDLKELSENVEQSGKKFSDFIENFNKRKNNGFPGYSMTNFGFGPKIGQNASTTRPGIKLFAGEN